MSNSNRIKDFLNINKKYIFSIISLISIVLIIYFLIVVKKKAKELKY